MSKQINNWRDKLHEVIFEADTPAGKWFDLLLILAIIFSVVIVILESVSSYQLKYGEQFIIIEWFFTILFTSEYILRIISLKNPWKYIFSFFGMVDLISILPSYLGIFIPANTSSLVSVRIIRLIRIFRVLKLTNYSKAGSTLLIALRKSIPKVVVFLVFVFSLTLILGAIMYVIEPRESGFSNIPRSVYWAIVTITTVGYGDIAPVTVLGQTIASIIMLFGYAIIAVPTGIVSVEIAKKSIENTQHCRNCGTDTHNDKAKYCYACGNKL